MEDVFISVDRDGMMLVETSTTIAYSGQVGDFADFIATPKDLSWFLEDLGHIVKTKEDPT